MAHNKHKKVRRYTFKGNEDLGDVRLEERMSHRTEGVGAGRKEAGQIDHKKSPNSRVGKGRGGRRGKRAGHRRHRSRR